MALPTSERPPAPAIDRSGGRSFGDERRQSSAPAAAPEGMSESFERWYQARFGTPFPSTTEPVRPPVPAPAAAPEPNVIERFTAASNEVLRGMSGEQQQKAAPLVAALAKMTADDRRQSTAPEVDVVSRFEQQSRKILGQGPKKPAEASSGEAERAAEGGNPVARFADLSREILGQGSETKTAAKQTADDRRAPAATATPSSTADDRRESTAPEVRPVRRTADDRRGRGMGSPMADKARAENTRIFSPNESIPAPPSRVSGRRAGKGDAEGGGRRVKTGEYDPQGVEKARADLEAALTRENEPAFQIKGSPRMGFSDLGDVDLIPGDLKGDWIQGEDWGRDENGYSVNLPIDIDYKGGAIGGHPTIGFGFHGDEPGGKAPLEPGQMSVEDARANLELALRAQREHAIGTPEEGDTRRPISEQVDRMTWEEYNALSPEERAGVDFNAQLVKSVRKDRQSQEMYDPTPEQKKAYDADVKAIFGEGRDSDTYAPQTLALLKQVGYQDPNADLDDFLGLNAAIHEKDLGRLNTPSAPGAVSGDAGVYGGLGDAASDRVGLARTLAAGTQNLQGDVAREGEQMLQNFNASATLDRNPQVTEYGGRENKPQTGPGYGEQIWTDDGKPDNLDAYFVGAVNSLVDSSKSPDETFNRLKNDVANGNLKPEELEAFYEYARSLIDQSKTYGVDIAHPEDVTPRTIEELDRLFGGGAGGKAR